MSLCYMKLAVYHWITVHVWLRPGRGHHIQENLLQSLTSVFSRIIKWNNVHFRLAIIIQVAKIKLKIKKTGWVVSL